MVQVRILPERPTHPDFYGSQGFLRLKLRPYNSGVEMPSLPNFHRGDTVPYNVTFTENGVAKDVSNMKLFITLKSSRTDTDANAALQKIHTFPADANSIAGIGTVVLTSAETALTPGKYFYDIQLVDPTPNPVVVTTLASGTIDVLQDISVNTA